MTLTAIEVAKATKPGRYGDGQGLYLQVTGTGVKSWLLRYEQHGRERWMGLGPLHTFSLKEARERARKARQQLLDGVDPLEARRAEHTARALEAAKSVTFEEAAREYFNAHELKWRNAKHRQQFLNTLATYVFPKIGRLAVSAIETGLVLKCVEPIWRRKTETANRVRSRMENVLEWATVRGYRTGANPALWRGHLEHLLPAPRRVTKPTPHPALAYKDLPAFMTSLRAREGVAARALEFTILTAARTGEVIGATWAEFHVDSRTWIVPASRMKSGKEHRVPLSDRALEVLNSLLVEEGNEFLFVGPRAGGLSNMAMAAVLQRMHRQGITVHGFRSTFRDWAAEQTNYPNHVVEMALAHTIGNRVEAAYRRGDLLEKRRRLMDDWARYCAMSPATIGNIVPLMKQAV